MTSRLVAASAMTDFYLQCQLLFGAGDKGFIGEQSNCTLTLPSCMSLAAKYSSHQVVQASEYKAAFIPM
ncbi:hypothetical protein CWC29_019855 [Pseudoalteromonas sp. S4498]|uniref:Uncharacterized protein n=1 Tax=Pseudoalteromonas galatheae TaxID=579562 RepID=A0A8T6YXB7_9GAMM|nr:hypothetical protein [Pseudoalteromonas galatheae]NKC21039.1 hypothetical protein [Pseudoalteromonas galatheae]